MEGSRCGDIAFPRRSLDRTRRDRWATLSLKHLKGKSGISWIHAGEKT